MLRIAIIIGSTRPGRKGSAVPGWVDDIASSRDDATFELVDLADYDLPHLDQPTPAAIGPSYTQPHTRVRAQKIASLSPSADFTNRTDPTPGIQHERTLHTMLANLSPGAAR